MTCYDIGPFPHASVICKILKRCTGVINLDFNLHATTNACVSLSSFFIILLYISVANLLCLCKTMFMVC
jgi:hypothetical protein